MVRTVLSLTKIFFRFIAKKGEIITCMNQLSFFFSMWTSEKCRLLLMFEFFLSP